jgi:capsular polysaccharide biosynthesis protein
MVQNITPTQQQPEEGLTFRKLLSIIRRHWIAIVAFLVVGTAGGFIWSRVETPAYTSTGTMLVSYEGASSISTDYTFSNYISNTYVKIIKEDLIMNKVAEKTNIPAGTLKSNTSVSNNSLVIDVSYTDADKAKAKEICQTIIETTQEVANTVDEADKPVYHLLYDNLKVFSAASEGRRASHTVRDIAIGIGAGAAVAFLYVLVRELLDNKFRSRDDIERLLNLPVLAGIPEYQFDDEEKGGNK